MSQAPAPRRKPPPLVPPRRQPLSINHLDHEIGLQNGSTSALELSPQRVQLSKQDRFPNLVTRLEDLTREMGYLRKEIEFYRQSFENLQKVRESCYDVYQQLFLALYLEHNIDRLHALTIQLRHSLENSIRAEAKAKKEWFTFWNMEYDISETSGELI